MKLRAHDYVLARISDSLPTIFKELGDLETLLLKDRLATIEVKAPVFITGLARSGTTILLTILSRLDGIATHRYRDFPFLFTPYFWSRFQDRFATEQAPVERPHRDRIHITRESPEAFEEPIWKYFFPQAHDGLACHKLTGSQSTPEFDAFFTTHIKKILLIRNKDRYLSKGNYNISRIEYLARLFPDARFVIPVRHPFTHVHSLARQHALFTDYARADRRVPHYLRAVGHFEFGPQRVPINFTEDGSRRIREVWDRGEDHLGYALLWRDVYRHVGQLLGDDETGGRTTLVRYEDLCAEPRAVMKTVLQSTGLGGSGPRQSEDLNQISASPNKAADLAAGLKDVIWRETEAVAKQFGYDRDSVD